MGAHQRFDWYVFGGRLLLLWGAINTYLDVTRYGSDWGMYWWFCNLALIGMGYGLLTKSRGWLTGFLSIACFTQVFWLIDNAWHVVTGKSVFGLVEAMYQPGLPLDEFILSHYHYFTMPIAFIALVMLPRKKSNALTLIAIFNPLIFGVSYFAFPAHQNINCIHSACFRGLDLSGPAYSITFWLVVFALHLIIGAVLEKYFAKREFNFVFRDRALLSFYAVMLLAVGFSFMDTVKKSEAPQFRCADSKTSVNDVKLSCRYSRPYDKDTFVLTYTAENQGRIGKVCEIRIKGLGKERVLHRGVSLGVEESRDLNVTLPHPSHDTQALLNATCRGLSGLSQAW